MICCAGAADARNIEGCTVSHMYVQYMLGSGSFQQPLIKKTLTAIASSFHHETQSRARCHAVRYTNRFVLRPPSRNRWGGSCGNGTASLTTSGHYYEGMGDDNALPIILVDLTGHLRPMYIPDSSVAGSQIDTPQR